MTFFLGDVNFFKQWHRAMAPMCCAIDVIQGEEKAYMGLLLPTLAVTLKRLEVLKSDGSLMICSSLIEVLQNLAAKVLPLRPLSAPFPSPPAFPSFLSA